MGCDASAIFTMRFLQAPVLNLRERLPNLKHVWTIEDVWDLAKESPPEPHAVEVDPQADRVAPYKKVREVEFVDAIPKSLSGKILRRDLIEQERAKGGG